MFMGLKAVHDVQLSILTNAKIKSLVEATQGNYFNDFCLASRIEIGDTDTVLEKGTVQL